ncbi:hypothetical protein ACGFYZ_13095 [Streptomyces sp. NPDC048330]|uniref:hypothetical protein n=1 Tax=Streptomyces sp. NPDC048330 TaxID=3365533 RepID=UPI00371D29B4
MQEPDPEKSPDPDPAPDQAQSPEVAQAERLLLSLRHQSRDLLLGVREARGLAEMAAEWLRRGVSAADLRHALTAHLPRNGIRSAVGFLRHRLTEKLPAPAPAAASPGPSGPSASSVWDQGRPVVPPPALVTCDGLGEEHVFRPVGDETRCGSCRTELARRAHGIHPRERAPRAPWRTLVEQVAAAPSP